MKVTNTTRVGFFVLMVAVLLFAMTLKAINFSFIPHGYSLKVLFKDIDGVNKNAPVTLNGFQVGRVTDIQIRYGTATRVELTLKLDEKAKLHQGAMATVKNMGFMGEKYIALTTGEDATPFLSSGAVLEGAEPADFAKILSDGREIAERLKEISTQIDERLKTNGPAIDEMIKHVTSVSANIDERLSVNKDHIDQLVSHLNSTTQNLEEMSCDLKSNPWKLLYRVSEKACPHLK